MNNQVRLNSEEYCFLESDDNRWESYVIVHPQANIFHHPSWLNLLAECYGFQPFIIAVNDDVGQICAGIPMMSVHSRLTGRRWISLPFTDYCPPLVRDPHALDRITREIVKIYQEQRVPKIEVRWELPAQDSIIAESRFVLHTIELNEDIESISKGLHRTQRQNIKTAEKNGVQIERGNTLDYLKKFYHLHCLTRRRHGMPVQPWRFFEFLFRDLIEKSRGFILLASAGVDTLAAGLFLHFNQTLTYKYSASSDQGQSLRPNHLLTWTAIRWGCENGFKIFDFGRTDLADEGLRTFKIRWGADELPLNYSTLSSKPVQVSSGRWMSSMQKIISNSPPWVCRSMGEIFYRHFA